MRNKNPWGILGRVVVLATCAHLVFLSPPALSEDRAPQGFSRSFRSSDCGIWHDAIEQAFRDENYCETDADCQSIELGGEFVQFGCFKYVNQSVGPETVYRELRSYLQECHAAIDECNAAPTPICISKKCVASEERGERVKKFFLDKSQITQRIAPMGACYASYEITVHGRKVGYLYREEPDNDQDSGWRFFAGDESEAYMADSGHFGLYEVNTIANYDPEIIPHLNAPAGSAYARHPITGEFKSEERGE